MLMLRCSEVLGIGSCFKFESLEFWELGVVKCSVAGS